MGLRCLIVDDAPFIRELIKSVVTAHGDHCVGEAEQGREAVALAARTLPDLVFLDIVLPRKQGTAVAQEIRDLWPEARIIACSTLAVEDLPSPPPEGLFDGWIVKPFTRADLEKYLDAFSEPAKEKEA